MGFVVWALLTALAVLAGAAIVLRFAPRLAIGEQVVAAALTTITMIIVSANVLGYASVLYAWTLGPMVACLSVGALLLTRPSGAEWRAALDRCAVVARRSVSPGVMLIALPVGALLLYLAAYVYLLPSWSWDALNYHDPIAALALQDHSLLWHSTPIPYVNSYPKNMEMLSLWNVIFAPDDRLLDGVQLPMALVGVVALASLCRRAGAPSPLAVGLSACWLLLPAVFLNIPSNYIDVSCASLWLAAVLFLARVDASSIHRVFGAVALGLNAGSKVTGIEHAAILVVVSLVVVWRQQGRVLRTGAAMSLIIAALGAATYVRNLMLFGNPVWPVKARPLGYGLPGTQDIAPLITPPWGGPDDLRALWRSFFEPNPPWMVDVRVGGFGPVFPYVLLPLTLVALVVAWRRRDQAAAGVLPILVIVGAAIATPASWWGRYTLGIPAAGLIGAAVIISRAPRAWVREAALVSIALVQIGSGWRGREGFHADLSMLANAASSSALTRSTIVVGPWQQEWAARREEIVAPGDASVYDDSVQLLYPLWRSDWGNRVLYRPWGGDESAWLGQLRRDRARWAAVREGGPADHALEHAGWTRLGACRHEDCVVWARAAE